MLPAYLWECSSARLSEFNLSKQNRAAEIWKDLLRVLAEYVEAEAEVQAVALVVEARRESAAAPKKPLQRRLDFARPARRHAERRRTA